LIRKQKRNYGHRSFPRRHLPDWRVIRANRDQNLHRSPDPVDSHEHVFEPANGGTLCRDNVEYEGYGGSLVNSLFVCPDLFKGSGYGSKRVRGGSLLRRLSNRSVSVRCLVRRPDFLSNRVADSVEAVRRDVLERNLLSAALASIQSAYYLIHSMGRMLMHLGCLAVIWTGWSWTAVTLAVLFYLGRVRLDGRLFCTCHVMPDYLNSRNRPEW
jgi:hypothetical protein